MPAIGGGGRIRILLVGAPGLLGAVVRAVIQTQADMAIVAEPDRPEELIAAAAAREFDVVVTPALGLPENTVLQRLLFGSAGVPIVAVSPDGRDLQLYARGLVREVGPDRLAAAIREAAMQLTTRES
jgi:DNA-binding NarL/FixJ family response regulator